MEILITGRLSSITPAFCDKLSGMHKIVAASNDESIKHLGKNATPYKMTAHDPSFEKLFHSHNFGAVLYFGQRPEEKNEYLDDLPALEKTLSLCSAHLADKFVYIASSSVYSGTDTAGTIDELISPSPSNAAVLSQISCEQLCTFYRERISLDVVILRTPSTFGYGEGSSFVGKCIASAVNEGSVAFPGLKNQQCDYLSQKDLGELLLRILDDWPKMYPVINVPGSSPVSFEQFGTLLKNSIPTTRVSYGTELAGFAPPIKSDIVRHEYDWVAVLPLQEEITSLIELYKNATKAPITGFFAKIRDFFDKHPFILRAVELILGIIVTEILVYVTKSSIQFKFVDFRLLYVVLLATVHGLKTGLCAALIACIAYFVSLITSDTIASPETILFNVDNWLPFACYIIISAIAGYTRDKRTNDYSQLTDEKQELEERYLFLNELYDGTVQNKGQYKTQIMSYRNSFGRIFEVAKKINSLVTDQIFMESIVAMEDILDNQSICIYLIDKNARFGRLVACSKAIANTTTKSLDLSKLNLMMQMLEDGEVWSNTDRYIGYPEYAAPIYKQGELAALITVQKAKFEQMAMYYRNLIKVLCGLVQVSLIRAIEFNESTVDKIYIPGTHIMRASRFKKVLEIKEKMQETAVSEYTLIRFNTSKDNMGDIGNKIYSQIRSIDVLGLGDDGELYLILSQTSEKNVSVILERLRANGLEFNQMN